MPTGDGGYGVAPFSVSMFGSPPAADFTGTGVLAVTSSAADTPVDIMIDAYTVPRGWHVSTVRRGWRSVALRNDMLVPA